jgi:divalent metal cation (Fe/Co/Zn/Cd) transporter
MGWWWADSAGALIMVPFILWQGLKAIQEAREEEATESAS